MPAERIAAVRKGCGAEFDAFRDAVAAAAAELAGLSLESADPAIMAAYLDQVVARRFEQPLPNCAPRCAGSAWRPCWARPG